MANVLENFVKYKFPSNHIYYPLRTFVSNVEMSDDVSMGVTNG